MQESKAQSGRTTVFFPSGELDQDQITVIISKIRIALLRALIANGGEVVWLKSQTSEVETGEAPNQTENEGSDTKLRNRTEDILKRNEEAQDRATSLGRRLELLAKLSDSVISASRQPGENAKIENEED